MSKTLQLFFIVLGLGIFIIPKQMIYAQNTVECSDQNSSKEGCCKTEKTQSCHSENPTKKSDKDTCGDNCNQCHSCTVHFVLNYMSPDLQTLAKNPFFNQNLIFDYKNSYFSSNFNNIWQPPKIG